jgi:hypothetical protein
MNPKPGDRPDDFLSAFRGEGGASEIFSGPDSFNRRERVVLRLVRFRGCDIHAEE